MKVAKTTNFDPDKDIRLNCTCGCGVNQIQQYALDKLQLIRSEYGQAMIVNSGYRCKNHPDEVKKLSVGSHGQGIGFDIKVSDGIQRARLVELGLKHGANVGVGHGFVHLDWRELSYQVLWVY